MVDNSPQAKKAAQMQAMTNVSPNAVTRRTGLGGLMGGPVQRQGDEEDLQMKANPSTLQRQGEEEDLQMKADPADEGRPFNTPTPR